MRILVSSDAYLKLAHFLCELDVRLPFEAGEHGRRMTVPIRQEDIGDALSITPVHTNRMLRQLQRNGLIWADRGAIEIPDIAALRSTVRFDPGYLQVGA